MYWSGLEIYLILCTFVPPFETDVLIIYNDDIRGRNCCRSSTLVALVLRDWKGCGVSVAVCFGHQFPWARSWKGPRSWKGQAWFKNLIGHKKAEVGFSSCIAVVNSPYY